MKERKDDNVISKKIVDEATGEERVVTLHRDHAKPTTRRDFLSTGLLGFSGSIIAPSILNVLARPDFAMAQSQDSCAVPPSGLPAFIVINLSGGAHISGELPPLGEDRQPLARYDLLGLGQDQGVFTNDTLGSNFFQQSSATPGDFRMNVRVAGTRNAGVPAGHMFLGISQRASQSTIDKTVIVNACTASGDDTSNNPADPIAGVLAAGLTGEVLPNLGSRDGTGTGVGQMPAIIRPPAPLIVRNYNDIAGALAPAGTLATRLTVDRRKKLLELVNSLSGSQARAVASPGSATGTMLAKVVECATGKNIELASKTDPGVDPGLDAGVRAVWGIDPANKNGANYARAAMVYNALKGNAPTCSIDDGGHDDHGNGRANQNASRLRAGDIIGRVLETAAVMNKPVFIYLVSDGSQSAPSGSAYGAGYTNDSGTRGQLLFFAFDPNARPRVKDDRFGRQLGFFTAGQGASDQTVVGTPQKGAAAAVANWLSFAGGDHLKKFEAIYPGLFQRSEIDGELVRIIKGS